MGQSPLRIESYNLRRFKYELKEEFEFRQPDELSGTVEPKIQVSVESGRNKEDDNYWRIAIDVKGGQESEFPYTFEVSFAGYFRVADNFPKDRRELLVSVNGSSILFAAAREFLALVTARSPYPPILLPSISFVPEKTSATSKQSKSSGKKLRLVLIEKGEPKQSFAARVHSKKPSYFDAAEKSRVVEINGKQQKMVLHPTRETSNRVNFESPNPEEWLFVDNDKLWNLIAAKDKAKLQFRLESSRAAA